MVEHGGDDSARTAGGSGDNLSARCVFLADGEGIGIDKTARFERLVVAGRMHVIAHGLTAHAETTGQHALGFNSTLDGGFHHAPYLGQVVPDFGTFDFTDIFPVGLAGLLTPFEYVLYLRERID